VAAGAEAVYAEALPQVEEVVTEVAAGVEALPVEALPQAEEVVAEVAAGVEALPVEALPQAEEAVTEVAAGAETIPIEALPEAEEVIAAVSAGAEALHAEAPPQAEVVVADVSGESDALYAEAMGHYRNGEWSPAHDALLRLKAADPARPGLDALLNDVERVMERDRPGQGAPRRKAEAGRRRSRMPLWQVGALILLLLSVAIGALMYSGLLTMPRLALPFLGNRAQSYVTEGYSFFAVDNYEGAIRSFNKALELDPDNAEAKTGLQHATQYLELRDLYAEARTLMEQDSFHEAIVKLQAILKMDPWYKDADRLLSQCQQSRQLEALYSQATGYYSAGEWAKAADAFEALQGKGTAQRETEVKSKLFDSYLNEGRQQIAAADSRSAIIRATLSFNSALALSPDDAMAQEERRLASLYLDGYTAYERSDWRPAVSNLSRIYATHPDYAQGQAVRLLCESYVKLGDAYRVNGQLALALDQYRLVLTVAQCDQTEAQAKVEQALALLNPVTPSPTATP
jgi:tetratricopeptide (TPR) repeat protein